MASQQRGKVSKARVKGAGLRRRDERMSLDTGWCEIFENINILE